MSPSPPGLNPLKEKRGSPPGVELKVNDGKLSKARARSSRSLKLRTAKSERKTRNVSPVEIKVRHLLRLPEALLGI